MHKPLKVLIGVYATAAVAAQLDAFVERVIQDRSKTIERILKMAVDNKGLSSVQINAKIAAAGLPLLGPKGIPRMSRTTVIEKMLEFCLSQPDALYSYCKAPGPADNNSDELSSAAYTQTPQRHAAFSEEYEKLRQHKKPDTVQLPRRRIKRQHTEDTRRPHTGLAQRSRKP